jgi:hypothetical protein
LLSRTGNKKLSEMRLTLLSNADYTMERRL